MRLKTSAYGYMRNAVGRAWNPLADNTEVVRAVPGKEPANCSIKPECDGCNMSAHGFICHFSDGTCLRTQAAKEDCA